MSFVPPQCGKHKQEASPRDDSQAVVIPSFLGVAAAGRQAQLTGTQRAINLFLTQLKNATIAQKRT